MNIQFILHSPASPQVSPATSHNFGRSGRAGRPRRAQCTPTPRKSRRWIRLSGRRVALARACPFEWGVHWGLNTLGPDTFGYAGITESSLTIKVWLFFSWPLCKKKWPLCNKSIHTHTSSMSTLSIVFNHLPNQLCSQVMGEKDSSSIILPPDAHQLKHEISSIQMLCSLTNHRHHDLYLHRHNRKQWLGTLLSSQGTHQAQGAPLVWNYDFAWFQHEQHKMISKEIWFLPSTPLALSCCTSTQPVDAGDA